LAALTINIEPSKYSATAFMFCRILWDGTARITALAPAKASVNELVTDRAEGKITPESALE